MTDTPQDPGEGPGSPLFSSRRQQRSLLKNRRVIVTAVVVIVVAGGVGGWLWYRSRKPTQSKPAPAAVAPTTPPAPAAKPAPQPALPALDSSDAFVRKLVSGLSSHPQLARWLATDKLVHRFVLAVVDVADGRSPEGVLGFLTPHRPFRARESGNRLTMDPASYRRYDALTAVIVSLDTAGVAKLYHELSPLMEQAYKDLGLRGGGTFQSALARAFGRLLAVSFPSRPPALVLNSVPYTFASPALEKLSPAAKHLIRFGPANGRKVQAKLRELAKAMGVVPVTPRHE